MKLLSKKQTYVRAKEICKQNNVYADLVPGFQKWYYNFCVKHKDDPFIDDGTEEVDPQDVDLIHTWWDECCTSYANYSNDWESPFGDYATYIFHTEDLNNG